MYPMNFRKYFLFWETIWLEISIWKCSWWKRAYRSSQDERVVILQNPLFLHLCTIRPRYKKVVSVTSTESKNTLSRMEQSAHKWRTKALADDQQQLAADRLEQSPRNFDGGSLLSFPLLADFLQPAYSSTIVNAHGTLVFTSVACSQLGLSLGYDGDGERKNCFRSHMKFRILLLLSF